MQREETVLPFGGEVDCEEGGETPREACSFVLIRAVCGDFAGCMIAIRLIGGSMLGDGVGFASALVEEWWLLLVGPLVTRRNFLGLASSGELSASPRFGIGSLAGFFPVLSPR